MKLNSIPPLTHDSPMPFGKHKGTRLGDIDASYLLWLLDQDWITQHIGLFRYLKKYETQISEDADAEESDYWNGLHPGTDPIWDKE